MKKLTLVLLSLVLIGFAGTAVAKKPHPAQADPAPVVESCTCDAFALNEATDPDQWESVCDVQWTTFDGSWPAYGASIEFEAEWFDISEMSAGSDTEIDDYSCVSDDFDTEADGDDERCTADDVVVVIPLHSDSGTVEFYLAVKGFLNGKDGSTSRDYIKVTGDCSPTPVL